MGTLTTALRLYTRRAPLYCCSLESQPRGGHARPHAARGPGGGGGASRSTATSAPGGRSSNSALYQATSMLGASKQSLLGHEGSEDISGFLSEEPSVADDTERQQLDSTEGEPTTRSEQRTAARRRWLQNHEGSVMAPPRGSGGVDGDRGLLSGVGEQGVEEDRAAAAAATASDELDELLAVRHDDPPAPSATFGRLIG